ncbi:MAG: SRPBCC domain-containing protein [Deltaproteobacteria bacterium]
MGETTLIVKKLIRAAPERVFEAFTKPEIMTKWFYAGDDWAVEVSNTLEVGGKYTLSMHTTDGNVYEHTGEYKEILPSEKLVFTWSSDFVQDTVVTVHFRKVVEGTEITLEHDFLPEGEMKENHRKGWTECLGNLDKLFA